MLLAHLVATSAAIAATRSRNAKAAHLATLLAEVEPGEAAIVVAYLGGELPQGRIGVGYAAVYGADVDPAGEPTLTVGDVDAALTAIAELSGPGSQTARSEALAALFARATREEQDFLRRLILRELRQGALEGLMVEALAGALDLDRDQVRRAAMVSGDLAAVAASAIAGGAGALARFQLTLFRPVQPMLAQTTEDPAAALGRFAPAVADVKLDGARIQLHKDGDRIAGYTRNLRDVTDAIPEVAAAAAGFDADRLILDGEVIALRPDGRPHPFQVTMSRFGRSGEIDVSGALPLSGFFFDVLHVDGIDLIDAPLEQRLSHLDRVVGPGHRPARRLVATAEDATAFFEETVAGGHEGIMLKDPDATYAAGRRGAAWLKLKPAHTLDLVVLAVEWGSGRRKGWLSNLHLGARDPATGRFVMLGKTFKGMTDEMLAWQTERFLELETHREGHVVHVRPDQVVEIAFDGVQGSSRYPGGVALRFARVKGYRHDKSADDADTIQTVREIFVGSRR